MAFPFLAVASTLLSLQKNQGVDIPDLLSIWKGQMASKGKLNGIGSKVGALPSSPIMDAFMSPEELRRRAQEAALGGRMFSDRPY